jgi:DNA-binding MarR family transcriptional regulator
MTDQREQIPLARLFAMAYRQLIEELHDRLAQRGWTDVRPSYGFVLLAARETPTTATELATLMGTTKQAASKLAATMLSAGYLIEAPINDDARARPLRLTARGRKLLDAVERIYAELEADWADVIGTKSLERLRTDLTRAVIATHDGRLPPVRPLR